MTSVPDMEANSSRSKDVDTHDDWANDPDIIAANFYSSIEAPKSRREKKRKRQQSDKHSSESIHQDEGTKSNKKTKKKKKQQLKAKQTVTADDFLLSGDDSDEDQTRSSSDAPANGESVGATLRSKVRVTLKLRGHRQGRSLTRPGQ